MADTDTARPETGSLGDRVATLILRKIASGALEPGDRLPAERRLAEDLHVSRVSVRAGLQKLKAQGLLTSVQGGGTMVAEPAGPGDPALAALAVMDRGSLADLVEIRGVLEVWAARRAAEVASAGDIAEIRKHIERMRDPVHDKAKADFDFHLAIAHASHSLVYRHLLGMIRGTMGEMLRYHRFELFGLAEHDNAVIDQHIAIAEAIAAHQPDAAAAAMTRHLTWVQSHYDRAGLNG